MLRYHLYPISLLFISATAISSELEDLLAMTLTDLSEQTVTVTSAAKKEQDLTDVPAAMYVITNDQIRRSGVRSVPEALALAPGVQVTKISEFNWQVSLRGLNEVLFNKLLVMVDGRSVFSPLMSGTFWNTIDTLLEDIDRIEVLRGTAGTMWGGNAANGVINIITKNSRETLGHYGELATGEYHYQQADYRYGFLINDHTTARLSVKGLKSDYYTINEDEWHSYQGNFRLDYVNDKHTLSLHGGGYHNKSKHKWYTYTFADQIYLNIIDFNDYSRGGYINVDYLHQDDGQQIEGQVWASTNSKVEPSSQGTYQTIDGNILLRQQIKNNHELTVGGGIRFTHLSVAGVPDDMFTHQYPIYRYSYDQTQHEVIYNALLQSEWLFTPNLIGTLGVKVEHFTRNDSTEIQPQARILYKPKPEHQIWSGIGRAVVTPSMVDLASHDYRYVAVGTSNGYFPGILFTQPDPNMDNESVITWDVGYRFNRLDFTFDSTFFYSQYDNVRMLRDTNWHCIYGQCEDGTTQPNYAFVGSQQYSDALELSTYGIELYSSWQALPNFTINGSYSFIETDASCTGSNSCIRDDVGGYRLVYENQPNHYLSLQTLWDINDSWQLDLWLKHRGSVSSPNQASRSPDLTTIDLRLAWQKKPSWPRVEFIVDSLGSSSYSDASNSSPFIEESAFVRLSWNQL